ncbi:hypothetical protein H4R19_000764 [Coemansia spiralis]|nr:hypothetical protein H4R19_000764 [Coemansia spiralis]
MMASVGFSGAGSRDNSRTPSIDRSARRPSWSSDDPASSSTSIASSQGRSSLWGKLRKQAGRVHTSRSAQLDHFPAPSPRARNPHSVSVCYAPSRTSLSSQTSATAPSRPSLALPMGGSAHTLSRANTSPYRADPTFAQSRPSSASTTASGVSGVLPTATTQPNAWRSSTAAPTAMSAASLTTTAAAASGQFVSTQPAAPPGSREQMIQSATGLERLKLIASLGDSHQEDTAPVRAPREAGQLPLQPAMRGSVDVVRRGAASQSMDLVRRAPNHTNPDDISAESIRQMLCAYTGKTEVAKSKPRLRRLLPHSPRRDQPADALGLARIAEDDEQPTLVPDTRQSLERRGPAMGASRQVDASKRLSNNSGSTASSCDTLWADADARTPRPRPRVAADGTQLPAPAREQAVPVAHRQAADWGLKLDPIVYRNTFINARPASDQHPPPVLAQCVPPRRLRRPSEPSPRSPAGDADGQEIDQLRWAVRILQSRNEMLSELVTRDPMEAVPEGVRLHIRTIELENAWLRRELAKRPC